MSLPTGTKLGPYEILSAIGAGGMGEVYRARDPRIGRDVAIKILPSAFSEDQERLRRFQQEAHSAGVLNHPNILAVHDVGADNGSPYIVSELLEGETLREKLRSGPLSVRKAIDYSLQIAHGLAAAHEKGITHRDLKPENLFVTKDGRIKILDFGLAKLTEKITASQDSSALRTAAAESNPGTVLGTVGYMSPEQVRGIPVDSRSDIFSFGAILYEMFTGKRAFSGNTQADTISAILQKDPPDLVQINPEAPAAAERIVRHCLEKEAAQRFQSAQDLAFALEALSGLSDPSASRAALNIPRSATVRFRGMGWIFSAILLPALLIFLALQMRSQKQELSSICFTVPPPPGTTFGGISTVPSLAISPDGKKLAFIAAYQDKPQTIWVRELKSLNARSLEGTQGAFFPFWSPDSQFVGYATTGHLYKVNINGGPPVELCKSLRVRGATWSNQGPILFEPSYFQGLSLYSTDNASVSPLTIVNRSAFEAGHMWPSFLPDGHHYVYYVLSGADLGNQVFGADSRSKKAKLLFSKAGSSAAFSPPGFLLFIRGKTLMAQAFNPETLELSKEAFPIASDVGAYGDAGPTGYAPFSVSNNGVLAYGKIIDFQSQLCWVDRRGNQIGTATTPGKYSEPRLSPDGARIAVDIATEGVGSEGATDVWLIETSRNIPTRFTVGSVGRAPIWAPDGKRVVFISEKQSGIDLYEKDSSGVGEPRPLLRSNLAKTPDDFSQNGQFLVYEVLDPKTGSDLWILPLSGDAKPFPFLVTEHNEENAQFSPDGQWIAYASDETGRMEVYLQAFGNHTGKWQVSSDGGRMPRWRKDGKELFYVAGNGQFMSVPISLSPEMKIGTPVLLFRANLAELAITMENRTEYDVSADGQRFLINRKVQDKTDAPITVITNWWTNYTK